MIKLWLHEGISYYCFDKMSNDGSIDLLSINISYVAWFKRYLVSHPNNIKVEVSLLEKGYKI